MLRIFVVLYLALFASVQALRVKVTAPAIPADGDDQKQNQNSSPTHNINIPNSQSQNKHVESDVTNGGSSAADNELQNYLEQELEAAAQSDDAIIATHEDIGAIIAYNQDMLAASEQYLADFDEPVDQNQNNAVQKVVEVTETEAEKRERNLMLSRAREAGCHVCGSRMPYLSKQLVVTPCGCRMCDKHGFRPTAITNCLQKWREKTPELISKRLKTDNAKHPAECPRCGGTVDKIWHLAYIPLSEVIDLPRLPPMNVLQVIGSRHLTGLHEYLTKTLFSSGTGVTDIIISYIPGGDVRKLKITFDKDIGKQDVEPILLEFDKNICNFPSLTSKFESFSETRDDFLNVFAVEFFAIEQM